MEKVHVTILTGNGSRFMPIYNASIQNNSGFQITQVYTHKKKSIAVDELAPKLGIRAARFNFTQMREEKNISRKTYENLLAEDILKNDPQTKFIFMTGWLLVFSETFLSHFPLNHQLFRVINIHPAFLPDFDEDQNQIILPDKSVSKVFRGIGDEVIHQTLNERVTFTGVTTYFVLPTEFDENEKPKSYDVGHVILREWLKIQAGETYQTLREKLNQKEDELATKTLNLLAYNKFRIENGKVRIEL